MQLPLESEPSSLDHYLFVLEVSLCSSNQVPPKSISAPAEEEVQNLARGDSPRELKDSLTDESEFSLVGDEDLLGGNEIGNEMAGDASIPVLTSNDLCALINVMGINHVIGNPVLHKITFELVEIILRSIRKVTKLYSRIRL